MGIATFYDSDNFFFFLQFWVYISQFKPFSINSEKIVRYKLRIVSFNSELQDIKFQLQEKVQTVRIVSAKK